MRGKLEDALNSGSLVGITPADAGKTSTASRNAIGTWDHPRGCGENPCLASRISMRLGSPPRMRGKQVNILDGAGDNRITPADAGKTP